MATLSGAVIMLNYSNALQVIIRTENVTTRFAQLFSLTGCEIKGIADVAIYGKITEYVLHR